MPDQWEYLMARMEKARGARLVVSAYSPDGSYSDQWSPAPIALNAFGAQGWELVGATNEYESTGTGDIVLIFKRRKQS